MYRLPPHPVPAFHWTSANMHHLHTAVKLLGIPQENKKKGGMETEDIETTTARREPEAPSPVMSPFGGFATCVQRAEGKSSPAIGPAKT